MGLVEYVTKRGHMPHNTHSIRICLREVSVQHRRALVELVDHAQEAAATEHKLLISSVVRHSKHPLEISVILFLVQSPSAVHNDPLVVVRVSSCSHTAIVACLPTLHMIQHSTCRVYW